MSALLDQPGRMDDSDEGDAFAVGATRPGDEPLVRLGVIGRASPAQRDSGSAARLQPPTDDDEDDFEYLDASGDVIGPAAASDSRYSDTQRLVQLNDTGETGSSDEEIVFDNRNSRLQLAGALGGRRRQRGLGAMLTHSGGLAEGRRVLFCRALLVSVAYFAVGLCTALIGPTLPDLQAVTTGRNGSINSIVSVVSVAGSGRLIGAAFGGTLLQCLSVFCAVPVCLLLAAACTLGMPFAHSLTALLSLTFAQGIFLAVVERGGYAAYAQHWRRRRARVLHVFYVAMAAGAVVAPLITTPLLKESLDKYGNASALMDDQQTEITHIIYRRAVENNTVDLVMENLTDINAHETAGYGNSTTPPVTLPVKPAAAHDTHNNEVARISHQVDKQLNELQQKLNAESKSPSLFSVCYHASVVISTSIYKYLIKI